MVTPPNPAPLAALRYTQRTPLEASLQNKLNSLLSAEGLCVVRVRVHGVRDGRKTLQIMIEQSSGALATLGDCERASRMISPWLDVEDPLSDRYMLELSSTGIERPLMHDGDFRRFTGSIIAVQLAELVEGAKRWKGRLCGVEGDYLCLERLEPCTQPSGTECSTLLRLPLDWIKSAHLVVEFEMAKPPKQARAKGPRRILPANPATESVVDDSVEA